LTVNRRAATLNIYCMRRRWEPAGSAADSHLAKLIMKIGPLPDALDPGFHRVRTQWNWGFMTFQLGWRTRSVMLTVPVGPESGFRDGAARLRPLAKRQCAPAA
jgi:hypothetical protein